jgi:exodeoxyribonuclease VII small subunit
MTETADISQLSYEQAMNELETIVNALESNQGPLEESMALFERGQALVQHCSALLDKAELKVRQVSGEELEDLETGEH